MANRRYPLTGVVQIEWVDSADPEDASKPPNLGWSVKSEPKLDDERLLALLKGLADALESDLAEIRTWKQALE